MKLLFITHRSAPYPGGTEIYVQNMAEEAATRDHQVAIFAGEHLGNYNGIRITNDVNILLEVWDLIVVHGGDVNVQNFVLSNCNNIPSPILYMLILPSHSKVCVNALYQTKLVGCSTVADWDHVKKYNVENKAVQIRHGITPNSIGNNNFKTKLGIENKKLFLSCGGYWPNKAMKELANLFDKNQFENSILVTTGYDNRFNIMPEKSDHVIPLLLENRQDVLDAIASADCYIMHSYQEGFGLVLLESMLNQTPWISRNIAGATTMKQYGSIYNNDEELVSFIKEFDNKIFDIESSLNYIKSNHLISNTIDDIENAVKRLSIN